MIVEEKTCRVCGWFHKLLPGHAGVCQYRQRERKWNEAVALTGDNDTCEHHKSRKSIEMSKDVNLPLLDLNAPSPDFDGETYEPAHDKHRLTSQLRRVQMAMWDGKWRTLGEIGAITGDSSEASISARLRDLRKEKFGAYLIYRRSRGMRHLGLFEYRMVRGSAPYSERCRDPKACAGKGYCPLDPTCGD